MSDAGWERYCLAEQVMFQEAAEHLFRLGLTREQLDEVQGYAEEAGSDVGAVVAMMLGEKEIPEDWSIPRV